ncbi:hypothetical protein KGMB02408_47400 [Bacteroides faecalis]|uniref:DUF3874 domain-containing protein n=1 Tax=Bacteroides faecalis TaxID=2447885 RepID=A0A401M275_9BACE|nr:hypothetical protein KGMB02408_47400 [Bacteroides faecalis]
MRKAVRNRWHGWYLCLRHFDADKTSGSLTGRRRFICIEVTETIDTSHAIDYEQLYAQAMYELDHGERYWFDQRKRIMTENNREFEQQSLEEHCFLSIFPPCPRRQEGEWLSPAEILEEVKGNSAIPLSNKRVSIFGRVLHKHEIPSKRSRRGTLYHVTRIA